MKNIEFIKTRKESWLSLEEEVKKLDSRVSKSHSESLLLSFINNYRRTIADLSLARSLFPKSQLVHELNLLIIRAMSMIGSSQNVDVSRIKSFYSLRLPRIVLRLKTLFFISCAIFTIATAAGFGLTLLNSYAANAIVGDAYIYQTLVNIEKGTPFAIYESRFKYAMSSFIMANNIKISFMAFAFGALYGIGTMFILFSNGLMLGSIAAVFAKHGLLFDFATTVMVHGTLELFAIMVAGAAGLRLGQALFRPGELKRIDALYRFGKEAFHICFIMIPVFMVAGALEGFVTHLSLPVWFRICIIAGSLLLLALYLVLPTGLYLIRAEKNESADVPHLTATL
jgi:uncharacterized membrane protein SpoIIM required for sporulation